MGNDTIFAGRGEATTFGGAGADTFGFIASQTSGGSSGQSVVIGDFTVGTDALVVAGYGTTASALVANQQNSNGSTTITLPDGTRIVLSGVSSVGTNVFAGGNAS